MKMEDSRFLDPSPPNKSKSVNLFSFLFLLELQCQKKNTRNIFQTHTESCFDLLCISYSFKFINNDDFENSNNSSTEIETLTSIIQSHQKSFYKTAETIQNEDSLSSTDSSVLSSALSSVSLSKKSYATIENLKYQKIQDIRPTHDISCDDDDMEPEANIDNLKNSTGFCENPVVSIVDGEDSVNRVEQQQPQQQKVLKKRGRKPKSQAATTKNDDKSSVTSTVVRGNRRYIGVKKNGFIQETGFPHHAQGEDLPEQYYDFYATNSPVNYNFNNTFSSNEDDEDIDFDDDDLLNDQDDENDDENTSDDNYSDIEKINRKKQTKAKNSTKKLKKRRKCKRTVDFIETILNEDPTTSKQLKNPNVAETYLIDRYKYAVRHIKQGLSVEEACNKYRISKGALLKCLSGGTAPRGKKTRLNENEENSIVEWLIANQNLKYNDAIHLVFQEVVNIFEKGNRPNPFHNGKPSMDWWYDFLSRHPQIMASKPEWLRRGKVNDQYILDVQSGKLRCTKFRRALLSAIQYIRSLNDANACSANDASSKPMQGHSNGSPQTSSNTRLKGQLNKRLSKSKKPGSKNKRTALVNTAQIQPTDVPTMDESRHDERLNTIMYENGQCNDYNNGSFHNEQHDMEYDQAEPDEENNFIKTILSNKTTASNPLMQLNTNDLDTKRLVVKVKFSNQHLLVADDDDEDDDDDIDKLKDSIDPSAFLP
jgi:hypothetical protein